jgi:hypothetical protein
MDLKCHVLLTIELVHGVLDDLREGANYLGACEVAASTSTPDAKEAAQFLALLREVLAGHRTHFELEYPCHSPSEQRWFMVRASHIEASDPPRYVIERDNVTALELAQQALAKQATTDELTGVATKNNFNGYSGFLGELVKNSFAWRERVVCQKHKFFSFLFVTSSASAEYCCDAKKSDYSFFHFLTFL